MSEMNVPNTNVQPIHPARRTLDDNGFRGTMQFSFICIRFIN